MSKVEGLSNSSTAVESAWIKLRNLSAEAKPQIPLIRINSLDNPSTIIPQEAYQIPLRP